MAGVVQKMYIVKIPSLSMASAARHTRRDVWSHCLSIVGKTPCQAGFGSCDIKPSPSCGKSSGTAKGRRIGYYQGWNTREQKCDKVAPRQINTRGLTHLFYSFVFFHPTTFEIMPMNDGDIPLYGEFTSLKRNGLQTWIAIGGVSLHFLPYGNLPNFWLSVTYSDACLLQLFLESILTHDSGPSATRTRKPIMPIPTWYQPREIVLLSSAPLSVLWILMASKAQILTGSTRQSQSEEDERRTPITSYCSWRKCMLRSLAAMVVAWLSRLTTGKYLRSVCNIRYGS